MTQNQVTFMRTACEMVDSLVTFSLRVDDIAAFVGQLSVKGMTEAQIIATQRMLRDQGILTISERLIGQKGLDRFEITPAGLRWWLRAKLGKSEYATLVTKVMDAYHDDRHEGLFASMAARAGVTLREFQEVFLAETNGGVDIKARIPPKGMRVDQASSKR